MKLLVLCLQSEGKRFSAGICRITFLGGPQLDRASLSYLRNYPFSVLKIDRSFVSDITVDPADRELVNAVILMAHGLGLSVIAEGVETTQQLKYLREKGCEFAQGYLFSEPVSPDEFSQLLK